MKTSAHPPAQTSESLSTLIQAVDAASSSESLFKAVRDLAAANLEGAIPTLIAALSYNNPGAAVAAVGGLVRLGSVSVPAIMEQLDGHNYTARAWAIRALAEIGDPRGIGTLLDAATADFAVSVRRAATKGLGTLRWSWFPDERLVPTQEIVQSALCATAQQDAEWVVRYAAVVGLEILAHHQRSVGEMRSQIQVHLNQLATTEQSLAVRARIQMAEQHLQSKVNQGAEKEEGPSPLTTTDWQLIQEKLAVFADCAGPNSSRSA